MVKHVEIVAFVLINSLRPRMRQYLLVSHIRFLIGHELAQSQCLV